MLDINDGTPTFISTPYVARIAEVNILGQILFLHGNGFVLAIFILFVVVLSGL